MTDGTPIAAQGTEAARLPGGTQAPPDYGPVGAVGGDTIVDVRMPGNPGLAIGTRGSSPSTDEGPAVGQTTDRGAPFRRSSLTRLPTGSSTVATVEVPSPSSLDPVAQATVDQGIGDATGAIEMSRQSTEGGLAVNIDAPVGAGGLGSAFSSSALAGFFFSETFFFAAVFFLGGLGWPGSGGSSSETTLAGFRSSSIVSSITSADSWRAISWTSSSE